MPSRTIVHNATSTSPNHSTSAVNEVFGVFARKLSISHIENNPQPTSFSVRRRSFKMDHLLHPAKKEKEKDKERKRDDSRDRDSARKDKRTSLPFARAAAKSKERSPLQSPTIPTMQTAKFEMIMESPPATLIGTPQQSSGAIVSGRLKLNVSDLPGEVTLKTFTAAVRATIVSKKPVSKECKKCAEKHQDLKQFTFLSEPKTFYKMGDNQFPWSCLFPGDTPATTHSALGSITYAFVVHATTSTGENIEFSHPIQIYRAVIPGPDKTSIRIFPPTNLTGRVQLPPVIHPIGNFPVAMTLSGIVEKKSESQTRWRLRKTMWRIEEHSKVVSTPCDKHKNKVSEGKAIQHSETRTLGNGELKGGWKTDFDTAGGEISLEFDASVTTKPNHKPTGDVDSPAGMEVKHNLVIELIVAEEFCPNKNTQLITPTGAARVLRMQFALIVTSRAGMGISWDEEMPPMYEDVPESPPGYGSSDKADGAFGGAIIEDYCGPEIEAYDLVRVRTENPNDPPVYRERDPNEGLPMRSNSTLNSFSDDIGPSTYQRPLAGFRLDDLEAEPQFPLPRRHESVDNNAPVEEDVQVGSSGAAAS